MKTEFCTFGLMHFGVFILTSTSAEPSVVKLPRLRAKVQFRGDLHSFGMLMHVYR